MYVFEIVEGTYSWLPGYASRDDDDISTLEGLCETVIWGKVALDLSGGCNMREVCGDARCIDDIIETELVDCSYSVNSMRRWGHLCHSRVCFEEKSERLTDSTLGCVRGRDGGRVV